MRKIFLDCGSNYGQGYNSISKNYDFVFETFMFEPNVKCFKKLLKDYPNLNIINKAVWNKDCLRKLNIEYCTIEKDFVGGSTNILLDEFIRPSYLDDSRIKEIPDETCHEIECIDLSSFIERNFSIKDFIILKLDIEGSEFEVLDKMIKDETLKYIKEIYIEWHYAMRKSKQNNLNYYLDYFSSNNIKYHQWV